MESEFYALCRGAATGHGILSFLRDLGVGGCLTVWSDSSAARSVASRRGIGKVRHLQVRYLWVQEAVSSKRLMLRCVKGSDNPADAMTKPLTERELEKHCARMGIGFLPDESHGL